MGAIRQSFAWWCYAGRGVEPTELLKSAAAIGYRGVEMIWEDHFHIAQDFGLSLACQIGQACIETGFNDPACHGELIGQVRKSLELAQKTGIQNLIVFAGNRREGVSDSEAAKIAAEGLSRVVKYAEEAGVTLILELLNSKVDHKGYQGDRTDWVVGVCKDVNSPRLKALYDIYHMQIMEGDLVRTITANAESIGHYHTAGNPGRHDLDAKQEICYPPVFAAIGETGFDGFIGQEFVPKGEVISALASAYELTEKGLLGI